MTETLDEAGFAPRRDASGTLRLGNCPFHALVEQYRPLTCGMNVAIMEGVLEGLGKTGIRAELDPQPGFCCVAFRPGSLTSHLRVPEGTPIP